MTSEPLSDIKLSIMIDAPLDVVWRNMTETDRVPLWLGCLKYEKRLGQTFYMQQDADKRAANDIEGATHCEVLELSEPERFVFSWFLPGTPKTTVTIALAAVAENRTSVEFNHSGWDQFSGVEIKNIRDALLGGWESFVLPGLKKLSENA